VKDKISDIFKNEDPHHPLSDQEVVDQLKARLLRAEVDDSNERMGNKIRKAQEQHVPYMLVVGEAEANARQVSLRTRTGEQTAGVPLEEMIARMRETVSSLALI